ncbi:DUF2075 domain-containing protein [Sporosarcina luteola]|uniref:DNA/RNA helicase domain-containing protein n=1 Tax=Sporosarcina luteola TaxID=582850 RepID=UPI00204099D3|nr:DNA/RNA helicase domain-containing protein [Sporosarcina luteola]MCM3742933.1 DUF2075 domain-containing protein [Sporosarcina luteola]
MKTFYMELSLKINKTIPFQNEITALSVHKKSVLEDGYVTYIYFNTSEKTIYIGETKQFLIRHDQHMGEDHFKEGNFNRCIVIFNKGIFTKTHAEDLEYILINHLIADLPDSKFTLFNRNNGKEQNEYPGKIDIKQKVFMEVWTEILYPRGLVSTLDIEKIRQSILYKYSPFKELTARQYEIEHSILENSSDNHLIHGGAGTGKTVLLMSLMYKLINEYPDKKIGLVTTSNLLSRFNSILKQLNLSKRLQFERAGALISSGIKYDVILVDEAHRLQRNYAKGHPAAKKHFINQKTSELEMLSNASGNLILFYDQFQSIRPQDIPRRDFISGTKDYTPYTLEQQLRIISNGEFDGNDYIKGLFYALGFSDNKEFNPKVFETINEDSYFGTVDSIKGLFEYLDEMEGLTTNTTNRVLAGYTRKWVSKSTSKKNAAIIKRNKEIENEADHEPLPYDWEEADNKWRWNKSYERWSELPQSRMEIGCIHAVQGADLDYIGVIVGKDLMVSKKGLVGVRKYYKDTGGTPLIEGFDEAEFSEFILDIYYVLLTRGISGCRVYFEDDRVKSYFMKKISEGTKRTIEV